MKKNSNSRVVVGLSGGVDSSVSLLLLKKQGYQPIGLTLRYGNFKTARKICQKLEVPYYIIDIRLEFKKKVIEYFLKLSKQGKTPNPCIICNHLVKFKALFDFAKKQGAQYVATGHYARVKNNQLLRAKDKQKDQSYFLCLLNQEQLSKIIFPLGDYTKEQVYQIAKKEGFDFLIKRKQSQDLCFIPSKILSRPGQIVDKKGSVLGQHQGPHFYTIGQRKKIRLSNGPWWVVGFDKEKNQLIVTNKENDPALYRQEAMLTDVHFISGQPSQKSIKVKAKIRFNQPLAPAELHVRPLRSNIIKLVFDKPQKAVTPGQWAVFYQGQVCLGGGIIV